MTAVRKLDMIDKKIISRLLIDGREKINKISEKTGISVTTVYNRLSKLIRDKIISVKGRINKKALGYGIEALVLITFDTSTQVVDQEKMMERLLKLPGIAEVYIVTGSIDMIAKVYARSIDELSNIVLRKMRSLGGISRTETLVILKEGFAPDLKFL